MLIITLLAAALQQDAPAQAPRARTIEGVADAALESPALRSSDLAAWRAHLLPGEVDMRFARIPWEPTFLDGVGRASEQGRPLLLWLMNGHPLGCT
ncbi:MAG: hypothetical protein P8M11_07990 [Planctomycetota bacterium]|nr:hypothetical protein [Planctomycetota bacterium]MDG1984491.1 hypothetical protein [Planctomycetota bacterium]